MFKDNLRKIRKENHYSQNELAQRMNTTQQFIANYEAGYREPKVSTIYKFCLALDCDFFDLLPASDILEGLENAKKSFKRNHKN